MDRPEPLSGWAAARDGADLYFNATAVAEKGRGVLLLGPSGSGKSSTALALTAYGARLISDDGVWVSGTRLVRPAQAPPLIEARGIGLLGAGETCAEADLALVVELGRSEADRLPPRRFVAVGDEKATLIRASPGPTLVPAILQLLRHGLAAS